MVKLRYVGVMAKGVAVCINYKINVEKNKVYDIPLNASTQFLATKSWEKANIPKENVSKKKEEKIKEDKVEDEDLDNEYKSEVE